MSDQAKNESSGPRAGSLLTMLAAGLVIVLAMGALLWPRPDVLPQAHALVVFDSCGDQARVAQVFQPLREYLASSKGGDLKLLVVRTVAEFETALAARPDFVFAPDGLALMAPAAEFLPLAVGRRAAPRNLRPRSVLVYRKTAGDVGQPWLAHTSRTVFGDSLGLAAMGVLRRDGLTKVPVGYACGPDPYDHGSVLHALRLGGFDYAVVRQWDAERFFAEGLLSAEQYGMRDLGEPVPDAVLLVSRQVPAHSRLRCGEGLSALGRHQGGQLPEEEKLRVALADLRLVGFNLLLEPDFELVRKNYPGNWLMGKD